jgi:hypothetical protein
MKQVKITFRLVCLAVLIAAVYAVWFSHFVPSGKWVRLSVYAACLCAIAGALLVFSPPLLMRKGWLANRWVRMPIFAVLSFLTGYQAFVAGFPAWYTSVEGTPRKRVVTVEDWREPIPMKMCRGPELVEAPMVMTVCLRVKQETNVAPGTKLLLQGSGTRFGMNVFTVKLAPKRPSV